MEPELPILEHWSRFLDWLLDRIERMPRTSRFTIGQRMSNLALDVLEGILEAAYSKDRVAVLRRLNLSIDKLRVFTRLCFRRRYINGTQYEFAARELDTAGRMAGGWLKHAT